MRESDDFSDVHGLSNFEGAVDVDRDRALVERCQGGDLDAFDSLYLHYHQRLLRFCVKRLQERSESEDVVQETFARAWRALPTFAGDRRFYPWLTVIAGNLCTDALRRRARLTTLDETMMLTSDVGSYDIEDAVLQDVDAQLVTTAFENLKPRHQRVLDLRERSGWSYQRIADQEGVGVSAVETLLWRARNALKREFALLAGAEGKAGALIGVAMTLPRTGLRRLSTSFRNHVPTSFRHAFEAGRHMASAVTPAGASMAAAGAVAVGLGAAYLSPSNSAIATPTAVAPTTTTVAPSSGTPGLGGTPPPTTAPALTAPAAPAAGGGAAGGAPSAPRAPSSSAATGGTGNGSSSVPSGSGSLPDPVAGLSQPIGGVAGAVGGVGGAVAGAGAGAGGAVSGLGNGVGGAVSGLGGVIGGVGGTDGSTSSGLGQATTGVTGAVGGVVSGAGSGLGQAITGVTGGVNNLLGGAPLG